MGGCVKMQTRGEGGLKIGKFCGRHKLKATFGIRVAPGISRAVLGTLGTAKEVHASLLSFGKCLDLLFQVFVDASDSFNGTALQWLNFEGRWGNDERLSCGNVFLRWWGHFCGVTEAPFGPSLSGTEFASLPGDCEDAASVATTTTSTTTTITTSTTITTTTTTMTTTGTHHKAKKSSPAPIQEF